MNNTQEQALRIKNAIQSMELQSKSYETLDLQLDRLVVDKVFSELSNLDERDIEYDIVPHCKCTVVNLDKRGVPVVFVGVFE